MVCRTIVMSLVVFPFRNCLIYTPCLYYERELVVLAGVQIITPTYGSTPGVTSTLNSRNKVRYWQ